MELRVAKDKKVGILIVKTCFLHLLSLSGDLATFFIRAFGTMCPLALSKLKDGALLYCLMMCQTANKAFLLKRMS